MSGIASKARHAVIPRRLVSPHGFAISALLIWVAFGICHALGWREYSSILSGNLAAADGQVAMGVAYVMSYFGCVVAAPILLLAAALFVALLRPKRCK
jgi:hypothetical protein